MKKMTVTSDQHGDDREDFLGVCVGGDVAEADAGEAGAGEVQRRHVGRHGRQIVHRVVDDWTVELLRQLVQPTCHRSPQSLISHYSSLCWCYSRVQLLQHCDEYYCKNLAVKQCVIPQRKFVPKYRHFFDICSIIYVISYRPRTCRLYTLL